MYMPKAYAGTSAMVQSTTKEYAQCNYAAHEGGPGSWRDRREGSEGRRGYQAGEAVPQFRKQAAGMLGAAARYLEGFLAVRLQGVVQLQDTPFTVTVLPLSALPMHCSHNEDGLKKIPGRKSNYLTSARLPTQARLCGCRPTSPCFCRPSHSQPHPPPCTQTH